MSHLLDSFSVFLTFQHCSLAVRHQGDSSDNCLIKTDGIFDVYPQLLSSSQEAIEVYITKQKKTKQKCEQTLTINLAFFVAGKNLSLFFHIFLGCILVNFAGSILLWSLHMFVISLKY